MFRALRKLLRSPLVPERLWGLPLTPIAQLAGDGFARVRGKLRAVETMTAPLSGRECLAYDVRVTQLFLLRWQLVSERASVPLCFLDDPTGTLLVELPGVVLMKRDWRQWAVGTNDPPASAASLLARHGHTEPELWQSYSLQYVETPLFPGEEVTVAGQVAEIADPTGGASTEDFRAPPMRPVIRAAGRISLVVSDEDWRLG